MSDGRVISRPSGVYYGSYRQGNTGTGYYYYDADNNAVYSPDENGLPAWLNSIPRFIGKWIGEGVNTYNQYSSQFERYWNSPANQMSQYAAAGVNPFEGFLQGSGGNGNPISPGNNDPLAMLGSYLSNFISLAHGLADLRSKNLANDSSSIDLLRKQFENKWFFGSPGTIVTETVDGPDGPVVVSRKEGYIEPSPQLDYETKKFGRDSAKNRQPGEKFNALKWRKAIDSGYADDLADFEHDSSKWRAYDEEYKYKRDRMEFEWQDFLKNEMGVDPHAPWWLTSLLKQGDKMSNMDNFVGRVLYGLMQFLKGNY